ncbi:MAG TPA: hypothetical protein VFT45_27890, partial [Longimicrobium sp.]|nr:hypothetical protein [Longimicrobium sp.]
MNVRRVQWTEKDGCHTEDTEGAEEKKEDADDGLIRVLGPLLRKSNSGKGTSRVQGDREQPEDRGQQSVFFCSSGFCL